MKQISFGVTLVRRLAALVLTAAVVLGSASAVHAGGKADYEQVKRSINDDPSLQQAFPRLRDNFEVIADATPTYNCIAWSLGVTDRWVNPETGPAYAPLGRMDRMYGEKGYYREQDLNWRLEPGYEKVVVYATVNLDATIHEVTHAAHQERDGTFTSKLGQLPVIRHATPEDLRGLTYGLPVAVYVRPIGGNAK